MHWLIPVIATCCVTYILQPYLNKKIADLSSRTRNLCWQYFFAAIFAIAIALIVNGAYFLKDPRVMIVAAIGIVNAFACYCYWRAIAISLSKTSLFTQADDLIAMALGYGILGEGRFLNSQLSIGIAFSMVAVFIFIMAKRLAIAENISKKGIAIWIMFYSIVWGAAGFSMRYFSLSGMPLTDYIAGWYGGAFVGALIVFALAGKAEAGQPLQGKDILRILPLSLTICISLILSYWARMLAPLIVSQPIFLVAEMVLPTVMGLWIFKELKRLDLLNRIAIVTGLTGGIIIALSW